MALLQALSLIMTKYTNGGSMSTIDYKAESMDCICDMTINTLERAKESGKILQGRVKKCDGAYNLHIEAVGCRAIIPTEETAIGASDGAVKPIAIITRVGRAVCFKVMGFKEINGERIAILSRRLAQMEFCEQKLSKYNKGDILTAAITRLEGFGVFVDVGCGVISMISIDNISVSRIEHPKERFQIGDAIRAVVSEPLVNGRISLSHKELLGTWLENAERFEQGQIVTGIVRSLEPYGIFIELAPNLAGLAEFQEGLSVGETAIVYIKNIIPEKMKIKLSVADHFHEKKIMPIEYFYDDLHMDYWRYSPDGASKIIESVFTNT